MTSQQQLPGGGGVRSLRAMFESSHPERSASPELRGRSPTPGSPSVRSSESNSRPTSKVRASFISVGPFDPPTSMPDDALDSPAVESPPAGSPEPASLLQDSPDGAGSTVSHRRGSMSLDPHRDSDALEEVKKTVSGEAEQRRASLDVQETIPEQAVMTGPSNTPFPEIKESEAMGSFINNEGNKLADPKKSSEPGPKVEATQENANKVLEEATKNLKRVELAAEERNSEAARKSSSAFPEHPAPAATPLAEVAKQEVMPPVEEPTKTQPDKKTDVEEESAAMKPSDPKDESAVSKGDALPPPVESLKPLGTEKPAEEAPAPVVEEKAEEKAEDKVEPQPEETANAASEPAPEPKSPEKQAEPAKAEEAKPKSPVPPQTPTSPIASPKSTTSKTSSAKVPAKRTSRTSLKSATSTSAPKPRASSRPAAEKKKEAAHTTPPFTKPRPKSPTRPAKLPSHLTAPTAASAAKRDAEKAEEKKPAARPKTTTPRAPAVASKTTTAAASKTAADAKKAGSRPSLPAQGAAKRPESRTSRPSVGARAPDDSFLARMMRPTAASASKTHEKKDEAVKSPPRRTVSTKTKQTNGTSVASKAKTKVVEGIDKAKEKVLDKDTSEKEEGSSAPTLEPAAPITEKPTEEEKAAAAEQDEGKNTPPQGAETPAQQSGETMTQTPAGIEGGVIR